VGSTSRLPPQSSCRSTCVRTSSRLPERRTDGSLAKYARSIVLWFPSCVFSFGIGERPWKGIFGELVLWVGYSPFFLGNISREICSPPFPYVYPTCAFIKGLLRHIAIDRRYYADETVIGRARCNSNSACTAWQAGIQPPSSSLHALYTASTRPAPACCGGT